MKLTDDVNGDRMTDCSMFVGYDTSVVSVIVYVGVFESHQELDVVECNLKQFINSLYWSAPLSDMFGCCGDFVQPGV